MEYRCRIETKTNWRGLQVWRWVIDRKFVRTTYAWDSGFWTKSETKAEEAGQARLRKLTEAPYESRTL